MKRRYLAPRIEPIPVNACEMRDCGRPATLGYLGEDPFFCNQCGTPCGDECCGVYEDYRSTMIEAAFEMRQT